jgi:hypothetical protein
MRVRAVGSWDLLGGTGGYQVGTMLKMCHPVLCFFLLKRGCDVVMGAFDGNFVSIETVVLFFLAHAHVLVESTQHLPPLNRIHGCALVGCR